MGEKCIACSKEFVLGDRVVTFRLERVLRGEKSGQVGFYEDNQSPEDEHVHLTYQCLEKCFSPADNPFMYDTIAAAVRKEIYEDEQEREELDIPLADPDDPPFCLWCKREDTVWLQIQRDMYIYNCLACHKLWDHNEDELVWDDQRGYVTVE
jgi:hypothetical protein